MKSDFTKTLLVLCLVFVGCGILDAREYHVAVTGDDSSRGSRRHPFKTITAAAQAAMPGDVVTVHKGLYRERVNPPRGGTSNDKRIIYQAASGERVEIRGSEIIKGWKKVKGDLWQVVIPNSFFGDFNPYNDIIQGEWCGKSSRHTGMVYLNGKWLSEFRVWNADVSKENTTINCHFKGVDPNAEEVEINVRQSIFYPDKPGRNYITVRGFVMRNAATPWAGAMSEQIGLIGTHWSKGWIIENNVISHSMNSGITLGRYDLGAQGFKMPKASAPGFVKSIEYAYEYGWSKKNIGGHIVRNNHISDCCKNGIHGSLGGIFSIIEGNTIHDISTQGWVRGADTAGLKLLGSMDAIIRNNHIYRCGQLGGIWLDWMAQGARVTGNLLHDNYIDLFMEVDHGPLLVDNNIFLSKLNMRHMSHGGGYVHNLFSGGFSFGGVSRFTPYFKPHTAEDMKLAGFKQRKPPFPHARYFNNIFFQYKMDRYDRIHDHKMDGNVFLGEAKPWRYEEHPTVLTNYNETLSLTQESDGWYLHVKLDEKIGGRQRKLITTERLGKTVVTDQKFENPDGSSLRVDRDYFGKKRDINNPFPGPFRRKISGEEKIRVWPK
jgi:alpha-N-arabinofuranosidase